MIVPETPDEVAHFYSQIIDKFEDQDKRIEELKKVIEDLTAQIKQTLSLNQVQ